MELRWKNEYLISNIPEITEQFLMDGYIGTYNRKREFFIFKMERGHFCIYTCVGDQFTYDHKIGTIKTLREAKEICKRILLGRIGVEIYGD